MSSATTGTDQTLLLAGNDQRFRFILDALSEFIAELTPEGTLAYANRTLLQATGFDLREVIGKKFWQLPLWRPETSADSIRTLTLRSAAGEQARAKVQLRARDGKVIDTDLSFCPIHDAAGLLTGILVCGIDITARKQAEEKVAAADRYLRQILDALFGFVGIFTLDGVVIEANRAPLDVAGLTREEVIGKVFWETYWWSYDPKVQARLREVMARAAAGEVVRLVTPARALGGRLIDVDATFGPLRSPSGAITGIVGFGVDITESRRTEKALRESEERLRLVIRGTNDGIWDWNVVTRENYFSPRWKAILGYSDDELPHSESTFFQVLHPDDQPGLRAAIQRHFELSEPFNMEFRLRHKNGSYRWVLSRGEAVRDSEGRPVRMVGSITDVTDHKLADQALFQREEQLRQVVRVSKLGVFDHDHLANTYYWSPGLRDIYGVSAGQPASLELFLSMLHPEDHKAITAAVRRAHDPAGDGLFDVEFRLLHPEGERWIATRAQTLFQGTGPVRQPARTVGASLDITERKLAEHQIAASLREKDTLLREIHHRVKNNLQIISSLLHFQAKKLADSGSQAVFQEGRDRLKSMILVHDKLYRSENLSAIDFGDYIRSLMQELARSNQTRSHSISVKVEGGQLALPIEAALPCGMILSELLTNVFKYAFPDGRPGDASVHFDTVDGQVIVVVKDNGVGLAHHGAASVQGFGMQLVHNLAEQLGGSIRVESGAGTTVTLQFPERSFAHVS